MLKQNSIITSTTNTTRKSSTPSNDNMIMLSKNSSSKQSFLSFLSILLLAYPFQTKAFVPSFSSSSSSLPLILIPWIPSSKTQTTHVTYKNKSCNDRDTSLYSTSINTNTNDNPTMQQYWYQKTISITAPSRGSHLITSQITSALQSELPKVQIGMLNLFIQHTSASLTINENADPTVRSDLEKALNRIVPKEWNHDGTFQHTMEGDDDMPGHVKSTIVGVSLNIPISRGRLMLGTWQGIYLNEHRDQGGWGGGHTRNIVLTLQGQG